MLRYYYKLLSYKLPDNVRDEAVRQTEFYYKTHPEFKSLTMFAEKYLGVPIARLNEIGIRENEKPTRKIAAKVPMRFHHLILLWEKGVIDVESLGLDLSDRDQNNIYRLLTVLKDDTISAILKAHDQGKDIVKILSDED